MYFEEQPVNICRVMATQTTRLCIVFHKLIIKMIHTSELTVPLSIYFSHFNDQIILIQR